MGLDTTHDCWHGAYSAFGRWRRLICQVAGLGDLNDYEGFGGGKPFPKDAPIVALLDHSDCDGEISASACGPLADALEAMLPALDLAGDGGGHIGFFGDKTRTFIAGLRKAAEAGEAVEFC